MFMGLFGDQFNLRLRAEDRDEALRLGAQP